MRSQFFQNIEFFPVSVKSWRVIKKCEKYHKIERSAKQTTTFLRYAVIRRSQTRRSDENLKSGSLETPQTSATVSKIENDQVVNDRSLEDQTKLIKDPEAKKPDVPEDWDAKIDDAEGSRFFIHFQFNPKFR